MVERTYTKELRMLADNYWIFSRGKASQINRRRAVERGDDYVDEQTFEAYLRWEQRWEDFKQLAVEDMKPLLDLHPLWPFLESIAGIAEGIGGTLIGWWGDLDRYPLPSKFIRHSGYGLFKYYCDEETHRVLMPVRGYKWKTTYDEKGNKVKEKVWVQPVQPEGSYIAVRRDRPIAGWVLPYNKKLKSRLYQTVTQFMKNHGQVKHHVYIDTIYKEYKEKYEARPLRGPSACPFGEVHRGKGGKIIKCSVKGHIENATRRQVVVKFLHHVWEYWRLAEGKVIRGPYAEEQLGHIMRYPLRNYTDIPIPAEPRPWDERDERAAMPERFKDEDAQAAAEGEGVDDGTVAG